MFPLGRRGTNEDTLWLWRRFLEVLFYLGLAVWLAIHLCRVALPVCLADESGQQAGGCPDELSPRFWARSASPSIWGDSSSPGRLSLPVHARVVPSPPGGNNLPPLLSGEHVVYLPVVYRAVVPTPDLGDRYEPDDTVPRPISTGETQTHNFHPEGDVDNVHFMVRKGQWYQVSTFDLAPGVDTEITVTVNGLRYWSNDLGPGHPESRVLFQAFEDDLAMVKIVNRGYYGPANTYRISLVGTETTSTPAPTPTSEPYPWPATPTSTPSPTITSTPSPTITPTATPTPVIPPPSPTPTPTSEPTSGWVWSELQLPEGEDFWGFFARNATAFVTVERQGQACTYRSDDRGEHWQELGGAAREVGAWCFWFSPSFPEDWTVFGAGSSVARSSDGGRTWARRDSGFSISYVDDVAFAPGYRHPDGTIYLITTYVDGHRHLYRSTDGGDWCQLRMDDTSPSHKTIFFSITAVSEDEVLMKRSGGLWRSEDGGLSWEEVPGFPGGGAIAADGTGRLWLGSRGGVCISGDGGRTWNLFSSQPPGADAAVFAGDGLVLCKVHGQQSASLYELRDGSWRLVRDGLDRYNSYVVVASRHLIYLAQPGRVERGERF